MHCVYVSLYVPDDENISFESWKAKDFEIICCSNLKMVYLQCYLFMSHFLPDITRGQCGHWPIDIARPAKEGFFGLVLVVLQLAILVFKVAKNCLLQHQIRPIFLLFMFKAIKYIPDGSINIIFANSDKYMLLYCCPKLKKFLLSGTRYQDVVHQLM